MAKDFVLETPFVTVRISPDGRHFELHVNEGVNVGHHHQQLKRYVAHLNHQGVDRINADHVGFDFLDRSINLNRGKRRLDLVYFKKGIMYECELKGPKEIGLNRTWQQVDDMARHCSMLTLLVPRDKIEFVNANLELLKNKNVVVDTYEF